MNHEPPFQASEFVSRISAFPWRRLVDEVHVHHTWKPSRSGWSGRRTIRAIEQFHKEQRGFLAIAQHLTIDPNGLLWTGRDWNTPPASAVGHNGNSRRGPFMFEMVGDFDAGRDLLDGPQLAAALIVCRVVCDKFLLEPLEAVLFHRDLGAPKTCPGSGVDREAFVAAVAALAP
jgi:hypothetical protein